MRYQLYRFGDMYGCFGTPEYIKEQICAIYKRPWWWLRLMGWEIKPESKLSPFYQLEK